MRPLLVIFIVVLVAGLSACTSANYSPNLIPDPDNRTVALVMSSKSGVRSFVLVDLQAGSTSKITIPANWRLGTLWSLPESIFPLDNRIFIEGARLLSTRAEMLSRPYLFDPNDHIFTEFNCQSMIGSDPLFIAVYHGKPCVVQPSADEAGIFSFPDCAPVAQLKFPVQGLGGGWMLRTNFPPGIKPEWSSAGWTVPDGQTNKGDKQFRFIDIDNIDILDNDANPVMHLSREQLQAAFGGATLLRAALSPDHHTLFLAPKQSFFAGSMDRFGYDRYYPRGFAMVEVPSGTLLSPPDHKGSEGVARNAIVAPAVLANDGLYAIDEYISEAAGPEQEPSEQAVHREFWLTRRTTDGIDKILQIPEVRSTEDFSTAASMDAKFIYIYSAKPKPHILSIPLNVKTTTADIHSVPVDESAFR